MNKLIEILKPLGWFVSAYLLGIILLPVGLIYDLGYSLINFKLPKALTYIWRLFVECLVVISWIIGRFAVGLDILGNVVAGEFIERFVTEEEKTLFRKSGVTISASLGKLETEGNLNKTGLWLRDVLNIFEKDHCLRSYQYYLLNKQFKND